MPESYTYTLFHNHCLAYARELLEAVPERTEVPKMERPAIGVIVLSAIALEAAVNHAVEVVFPPRSVLEQEPVFRLARNHVTEPTNPMQRLERLALAMEIDLDQGQKPWQSAGDVYALRNALVHYQANPVLTSEEGPIFEDKARLRNRAEVLGVWGILEDEGGTWLDVFLNRPCSQWALESATEAVQTLQEPPWRSA